MGGDSNGVFHHVSGGVGEGMEEGMRKCLGLNSFSALGVLGGG